MIYGVPMDSAALPLFLLLVYVPYDLWRNRSRPWYRRLLIYSLFVYFAFVCEYTLGNIRFPSGTGGGGSLPIQAKPFHFVKELIDLYRERGTDWWFWNRAREVYRNFLLLMPMGVYWLLVFGIARVQWALIATLLVSLTIETAQLVLTYFQMFWIGRSFTFDDVILNTAGGVTAYLVFRLAKAGWDWCVGYAGSMNIRGR